MSIDIGFLELTNGKCPYLDWEQKLDKIVRGTVRIRINRLRLGNFGDCKSIKGATGLYELRIHMGAGYRLYLGKANDKLIIFFVAEINALKDPISKEPKIIGNFIKSRLKRDKLW